MIKRDLKDNFQISISGQDTWYDMNVPGSAMETFCKEGILPDPYYGMNEYKWTEFWKITFPLIMPFVSINLVLSTKNFLMVFDQIMALTKGGPAQSTESISYLIYNNGMSGGQFGFQSANAVIFFIVIVVISVMQLTITGKKEEQL